MKDKTDLELCEMYKAGNEEAFEVLWKHNINIARKVVNKNKFLLYHFDKEDLMSECAIKFVDAVNTYNGEAKLSTYYYKIISNALFTKLRKVKSRKRSIDYSTVSIEKFRNHEDGTSFLEYYHGAEEDDHSLLESPYFKMMVESVLENVPQKYQNAMIQRMLGYIGTDKEVAEDFGVKRQNIWHFRQKVVNDLRMKITKEAV